MNLSKYLKALIISTSIVLIITAILIIFGGKAPGFILFFPISMPIDSLIIFVITIVISIICGYSMGYILAPLFVQVHKKILGRKMIYGIENRPETEKFKGYILKALWPALLSINLAITLSKYTIFQQLFTSTPVSEGDSGSWEWATFIALLPLTTGISLTLFSPVLHLSDAGIIYHNKEKIKDLRDSTEVRNVGLWYNNILKGYAGISVIIAYFEFIQRSIEFKISIYHHQI